MRAAPTFRVLSLTAIFTLAAACDSESIGPATSGVGSVTVIPSTATIGAGQALQLTARLVDEFGEPLEGVTVSWSSTNPSVATVSVGGTVFGH
ncbi:MAG TPA: Ig-like domain-containing protein [Gemmatimonadales bacterium]|nr:Ig-like domain-containing protein [Gemmatimonadales bacterium]